MPNTAQDFLSQAKTLQAASGCEMEWRTATNRGYYSVFHNASDIKNSLSLPDAVNQRGGSHGKLYNALEECRPMHSTQYFDVRRFGIMAGRLLKPYRVNADYDVHLSLPSTVMEEVVAKAELLMNMTAGIISGHKPGGSGKPAATNPPSSPTPSFRVVK